MKKFELILAAAMLIFSSASCCRQTEQTMSKDFLDLAKDRYSVRKFSDTPVEQEKIDKIIEAGRVAPTAVNSQPQMIYVAKSPEAIEKLNKLSGCIYGAPQVFIYCYNDETVCKKGEYDNYGDITNLNFYNDLIFYLFLNIEKKLNKICFNDTYYQNNLINQLQIQLKLTGFYNIAFINAF